MVKDRKRAGPGTDVVEEWHETLVFLQDLEQKSPDDPRWPLKIGKIFSVLGRKREAVQAMARAARLHRRRGENAEAVAACRQALEEDPNHEPALTMLTEMLQDQLGASHNGPSAYGPLPARGAPGHRAGHASNLSRVAPEEEEIVLPEVQTGENRRITLDLEIPPRREKPRRGNGGSARPIPASRRCPSTTSSSSSMTRSSCRRPSSFRHTPRLAADEAPLDPGIQAKNNGR